MKKLLRKSVAITLTGSALGLVSTQASALAVVQDLNVGDTVTEVGPLRVLGPITLPRTWAGPTRRTSTDST